MDSILNLCYGLLFFLFIILQNNNFYCMLDLNLTVEF